MNQGFLISRDFVQIVIQPLRGMLRFAAIPVHSAEKEPPSFTITFDAIVQLETLAARCLNRRDQVGDAAAIDPIKGRGGMIKLYVHGKQPYLRLVFYQLSKQGAGGRCPQCGQGQLHADRDATRCSSCEYVPGRFRIDVKDQEISRLKAYCEQARFRQAVFDEQADGGSARGKGQSPPPKQKKQPARKEPVRGGDGRPAGQPGEGKPSAAGAPSGSRPSSERQTAPRDQDRPGAPRRGVVLPDDEVIDL